MLKLAPLLLAPLLLLAAACDGDSGDDDDIVATVFPETPEASPTADGGEPTPTPTSLPDGEPTPTEQPGGSPTPAPEDGETPAPEGTPAVGPADLDPYQGMSLDQSPCGYDPIGALANCPGYGIYSPSPAPTGQDITCSLYLASGEPALVFCRSAEPVQSTYYEIQ